MSFKELINQESIIYAVLLLIAIVLAISNYGASSTVQTIAVFYCILQFVINISIVYSIIKKILKKQSSGLSGKKKATLLVSFGIIGILFFTVLTDYFRDFVFYYSAIILGFLLIYDLGKMILKKSF